MALLAVLALCGAPALAQPAVFFDDFEGNALLPHWSVPPPSYWEYNVSNSMLNVTGLFFPSNPKSSGNYAGMGAPFTPLSDFQADVWMGWEAGEAPHELEFDMLSAQGAIIASCGYSSPGFGNPPFVFAGASNQAVFLPPPPPGMYQFTINRTADQFNFYLNGSPIASFHDNFGSPAAGVHFEFVGPYPGQLGAFQIDRVVVVPAPGSLLGVSAALALACARRRKR